MKLSILLLTILFSFNTSISQNMVVLHGTIINPKGEKVYVQHYKDYISYDVVLVDSAMLDKQGNFSMSFQWEQPSAATFFHGDEITEMFLSADDNLNLTLDTDEFDETLRYEGRGSIINNYLAQKTLNFPRLNPRIYKSPEIDFCHAIDSIKTGKLNFHEEYFSSVSANEPALEFFKSLEADDINYEWAEAKMTYPSYNRYLNKLPSQVQLTPEYYNFLKEINTYNPNALHSINYLQFLSGYVDREIRISMKNDTTKTYTDVKQQFIDKNLNGSIKEFVLAEWAYSNLTQGNDIVQGQIITDQLEEEYPQSQYLDLLFNTIQLTQNLQPGNVAPDFTFPDQNGKMVSLSDFIGKVVYLDIWASWCGPCMNEVPHAKKLQEDFEGKEVVFLYVSVDADENAWKNTITQKELGGVHLLSNSNSSTDISALYNAQGIPQYVLIGKDGNIVDSNAKRPSGNIKEDLEALLE